MIFASENMLIPIPATIESKKLALIPFQKAAIFPVNNCFNVVPLILLIESISSS